LTEIFRDFSEADNVGHNETTANTEQNAHEGILKTPLDENASKTPENVKRLRGLLTFVD